MICYILKTKFDVVMLTDGEFLNDKDANKSLPYRGRFRGGWLIWKLI